MFCAFCFTATPLRTERNDRLHLSRRGTTAYACLNEPGKPTELSRRVFNTGILFSGIATTWVGYRIVVGDDLKSQAYKAIRRRVPGLFPRESTPDERRGEPNEAFVSAYFDAVAAIAVEQSLIDRKSLEKEEFAVRELARPLFFDESANVSKQLTNSRWLNFVLYARLHAIAERTSPLQRRRFANTLAERTLPLLKVQRYGTGKDVPAVEQSVRAIMNALIDLHWISGYNVTEMDSGSWEDEGFSRLTVFANDPLPLQAAQLIGEEQFAEISPLVSPWITHALEKQGINVSAEDYYLDDVYRPDPVDFMPTQLATELDLSVK